MQDSREIDYFGQRILQIVQPLAATKDRREVLALLAQSVANNFAADGCWILQYLSPGVVRVAASACASHRTNVITDRLPTLPIPIASTPIQWRMQLLPDYQMMVVDTRDGDRVTGCLVVATKGVEWYRETKLVFQVVSEYVGVGLIEEDLQVQAQISQLYPKLHHNLAQAIVENKQIDRLFEIAVSDMVGALQLKRGLVLSLKSGDFSKQPPSTTEELQTADPAAAQIRQQTAQSEFEISEWDRPLAPQSPATQPPSVAREIENAKTPTMSERAAATPAPNSKSVLPNGHSGEPQPERCSAVGSPDHATAPRERTAATGSGKTDNQIQIVTTIDRRKGNYHSPVLPSSFLIEDSQLCQTALANAPSPTIFNSGNIRTTPTDRLIFQDDRLPSIVMIPLMGSPSPERQPTEAIWGWLVLQDDRSRHWHPVELKLLQCQIYQIALARIQRKALKQARSAVASRTSQVQTSLQLQAKLHDVGRKRMEKLRQANELKDEFISTIGHELRTPLTSMSLAIKMLRQSDVDPDRRKQYLDILDDQCQREIKLVNDLLKFQQFESKQVEFRPQRLDLNQFISEQASSIANRWQANKSLELLLHLPHQLSPQIETDPDSLKHVLEELLINAGKFAIPNTMVEVGVKVEPERAILEVTNLSKPISKEDLPNLFERFRRGSGTTQQAIAGTGLGLALVKSMVEHVQGTISVTSEPIEPSLAEHFGTKISKTSFTVTLPTILERH
jgi:signal transduction histidine kinase